VSFSLVGLQARSGLSGLGRITSELYDTIKALRIDPSQMVYRIAPANQSSSPRRRRSFLSFEKDGPFFYPSMEAADYARLSVRGHVLAAPRDPSKNRSIWGAF